jgi:hypothetical protein
VVSHQKKDKRKFKDTRKRKREETSKRFDIKSEKN